MAGAAVLLSCAWVGWQTYQSYRHLTSAREQILELKSELGSLSLDDVDQVRLDGLQAGLDQLRGETQGAVDASDDPLVRLARHLPFVGPNLSAVSDLSRSADDLADQVLPALFTAGRQLTASGLAPLDGRIDPAPVAAAAAALGGAADEIEAIDARLAGVDPSSVVGPVAEALVQFRAQLTDVRTVVDGGARTGRIVSELLGGNGSRQYLLVFQNLAEPRATGGIPGSYALLTVEDGRPALSGQGSASRDLGEFEPPVDIPAEASLPEELYYGLPQRFPQNTTMTPDFPTSAQLLSSMYTRHTGTPVDGVISVDPVVLQRLLDGADPIDVPGGTPLDSTELARYLLSTVYADFDGAEDPRARDDALAAVTASAFAQLLGQDARTLVDGVQDGIADRRIMAWSADEDTQTDLVDAGMAGGFTDAGSGFGAFRNDGTGGKVGYWTDGTVRLALGACSQDRRAFTLTVEMSYTPPDGPLPAYVTGAAPAGVGVLRTNLMFFAPAGAVLQPVQLDGVAAPAVVTTQSGLPVTMITVDQQPGGRSVAVLTGTVPSSWTPVGDAVTVTPGVTDWDVTSEPGPSCD